jgi:hypothetical protein
VSYGNGTFVVTGFSGEIVTSPDCATWTSRFSGTTNELCAVAYGKGTFIAVGGSGTILSSPSSSAIQYKASSFPSSQPRINFSGNSVRYTLPEIVTVFLKLYDLQGRCIATLVNGPQPAGLHEVRLPSCIANGTYVLSLKAGDYTASGTVIMEK